MSNRNRLERVRGQIAEVKTQTYSILVLAKGPLTAGLNLCNLTSDLCNLLVNCA
jgi:hypothetical protein